MQSRLRTNLALKGGKGDVAGEATCSFGASDGHDRGSDQCEFPHSFAIFSLLDSFMHPVKSCQVSVAVGGGIWVENPHVKEGLLTSAPETIHFDVQSCLILPVGGTWSDALTIQSLQPGFHRHIVAHFPQQFCR